MTDKKYVKAQSVDELEALVAQGDMDAKRELARRLIEGNGVPQNHPKAVALLEDCVALGDTDAMLMLSKCCAFGYGTKYNAERAESLISEAASKGNHEAVCLMKLIGEWKEKQSIDLRRCLCDVEMSSGSLFKCCVTGRIGGKLTIERVFLLLNIVPCNEINLSCQSCSQITEHLC